MLAIEALLQHGEDYAMNHFNKDPTATKKAPAPVIPVESRRKSASTTPSDLKNQ